MAQTPSPVSPAVSGSRFGRVCLANSSIRFAHPARSPEVLKNLPQIADYGEASHMPVFGGKLS